MAVTISFNKYYVRSLANLTTTTIFTAMTRCVPACTLSQKGAFWQVVFGSVGGEVRQLLIINVISPPTTEPVDVAAVQTI